MTYDKIVDVLDSIVAASKSPIVAFSVREWDYNGQIQVEATFQVAEPKSYATASVEASK